MTLQLKIDLFRLKKEIETIKDRVIKHTMSLFEHEKKRIITNQ